MTERFRIGPLEFEWEAVKARSNAARHGVTFEEAARSFIDPLARIKPDDAHSQEEPRWVHIGRSIGGRLLVTAYTPRDHRTRIISSSAATRRERHDFEEARA